LHITKNLLQYEPTTRTDNRQPTTENPQTTTDNRQPTTDNREPTTDNREPTTDNRHLSAVAEPTTDNPSQPLITPLPFDSNLFGYPVGKCEIGDSWNENEFMVAAENFSLIYLFSKEILKVQDPSIQLVDQKLIFQKELDLQIPNPVIFNYEKKELELKLKELAFQSGIYSRFKTDNRLVNQEFEKLYSLWIQKAMEHDEILTDSDLHGMITLSFENENASIGLFAVSEESRGKGLGAKLIKAAEQKAFIAGSKILTIPTQAANVPAVGLYKKLGYKLVDTVFVYHYWNGKLKN